MIDDLNKKIYTFQNNSEYSEIIKFYEDRIEEYQKKSICCVDTFSKLVNKFSDPTNPNVCIIYYK